MLQSSKLIFWPVVLERILVSATNKGSVAHRVCSVAESDSYIPEFVVGWKCPMYARGSHDDTG